LANSGTVLKLIVLLQEVEELVSQEEQPVLILKTDHIVDMTMLGALEGLP